MNVKWGLPYAFWTHTFVIHRFTRRAVPFFRRVSGKVTFTPAGHDVPVEQSVDATQLDKGSVSRCSMSLSLR